MSLFLPHDELVELTGFKQNKGHVRWLQRNGWRYALTRSQQPRVARDYSLTRFAPQRTKQRLGFSDLAAWGGVERPPRRGSVHSRSIGRHLALLMGEPQGRQLFGHVAVEAHQEVGRLAGRRYVDGASTQPTCNIVVYTVQSGKVRSSSVGERPGRESWPNGRQSARELSADGTTVSRQRAMPPEASLMKASRRRGDRPLCSGCSLRRSATKFTLTCIKQSPAQRPQRPVLWVLRSAIASAPSARSMSRMGCA